MLEKAVMQRLTMSRYMYTMAVEQSIKPEPLNMVAILHFHDAVELFLCIASEYLDVGKTGEKLMEYFGAINQKLQGTTLAQKDAIKRLNDARNSFKHQGIQIASSEIEAFRLSIAAFFGENTQKVFSLNFDELSMSSLVFEDTVRERLEEAEICRNKGDIVEAVKKIAIAFQELLNHFKWRFQEERVSFPFEPGPFRRQFFYSPTAKDLAQYPGDLARILSKFADSAEKSFKSQNEQIKILSLGVNYQSYVRFQLLTPRIYLRGDNDYQIVGEGQAQSSQDYAFCYNFVIESALRLQEFRL